MRSCGLGSIFSAVVIGFLLIGSLSCLGNPSGGTSASTPRDTSLQPQAFGGARLEVEAPFSTAVVEIKPDGTVRYEASSQDTGNERQGGTKTVGSDDLSHLTEAIQNSEFFSLKASYPYQAGGSYEDGSTYSIQVSIGGETKGMTCYESECPARFSRVMDAIRQIWGEEILEVGV